MNISLSNLLLHSYFSSLQCLNRRNILLHSNLTRYPTGLENLEVSVSKGQPEYHCFKGTDLNKGTEGSSCISHRGQNLEWSMYHYKALLQHILFMLLCSCKDLGLFL